MTTETEKINGVASYLRLAANAPTYSTLQYNYAFSLLGSNRTSGRFVHLNHTALADQVADLLTLKPGWNNGDGVPPTHSALRESYNVGRVLEANGYGMPKLFPVEDGGVDIQARTSIGRLVIEFDPAGMIRDVCVASKTNVDRPDWNPAQAEDVLEWLRDIESGLA